MHLPASLEVIQMAFNYLRVLTADGTLNHKAKIQKIVLQLQLNISFVRVVENDFLNGFHVPEGVTSDTKCNGLYQCRLSRAVMPLLGVVLVLAENKGGHILLYLQVQFLKRNDIPGFNML